MFYYDENEPIQKLVGHKITQVDLSEDYLEFYTDKYQKIRFGVDAECCSHSYFYDIVGKEKLYENGPVVSARMIPLDDPDDEDSRKGDVVRAYGGEIVTVHEKWGEQTTVFSFRNDSNGYYGGSLEFIEIVNVSNDGGF